MTTTIETTTVDTPAGRFWLAARDGALVGAEFAERVPHRLSRLEARFGPLDVRDAADPAGAASALKRFLAGELTALGSVPLDAGGTPFQRDVWAALREIPPGTTTTYADLAARVGRRAAVRAVGGANGANPVAVFVPCHRVVGKDGLRGYAGGLDRKAWLLTHEKASLRG
jgi:methylated-DNA-[protein]-cysteine S-methyltransferase